MTRLAAVSRTVEVAAAPATAFHRFTAEMGEWYRSLPHSWNDPARAVGIRIEPCVGGRWVEVWDAATGEGYEIGRVRVWEPGRRFVVTYRNVRLPPEPLTEVEVRFEPVPGGTRVVLEHRGWDRLPPEAVAAFVTPHAYAALAAAFAAYVSGRPTSGGACRGTTPSPPARRPSGSPPP